MATFVTSARRRSAATTARRCRSATAVGAPNSARATAPLSPSVARCSSPPISSTVRAIVASTSGSWVDAGIRMNIEDTGRCSSSSATSPDRTIRPTRGG